MSKFINSVLIIGFMMVFGSMDLLVAEANDAEILQSSQALLFSQTYMLKVNDVESKEQKDEKPSLNAGKVVGEILAGGLIGFGLGGVGGGYIGYYTHICWDPSQKGVEFGGVGGAVIGAFMGYIVGNSLGVYLVGNIGNETGSFLVTLGGSMIAGMSMFAACYYLEGGDIYDISDNPLFVTVLAGPPIGATIGFNLTRRYKSPPTSKTALINFRDGQMTLAVPTPYFQHDSFDGITRRVDLVKMRF